MNILAYALTAFLVLLSGTANSDERMLPHIEWLVANSDFEYNGEPLPSVEYISFELMQVAVYGPETVAQAEYNGSTLPTAHAYYDDERDTIVLQTGFDWDSMDTMHIMVHELVHYLQDINGITDPCLGNLEPEAYQLHDQWMVEHNSPAERPNMLFVYMLRMSCLEDPWYGHDHAR